jgi:hypothetical protein
MELERCLALLGAPAPAERLLGLLLLQRHLPPSVLTAADAPAVALRARLLHAVGARFLMGLLTARGGVSGASGEHSGGSAGDVASSGGSAAAAAAEGDHAPLALNLMASFARDAALAPKFRPALPPVLRLLRSPSTPLAAVRDAAAVVAGVLAAGCDLGDLPLARAVESLAAALERVQLLQQEQATAVAGGADASSDPAGLSTVAAEAGQLLTDALLQLLSRWPAWMQRSVEMLGAPPGAYASQGARQLAHCVADGRAGIVLAAAAAHAASARVRDAALQALSMLLHGAVGSSDDGWGGGDGEEEEEGAHDDGDDTMPPLRRLPPPMVAGVQSAVLRVLADADADEDSDEGATGSSAGPDISAAATAAATGRLQRQSTLLSVTAQLFQHGGSGWLAAPAAGAADGSGGGRKPPLLGGGVFLVTFARLLGVAIKSVVDDLETAAVLDATASSVTVTAPPPGDVPTSDANRAAVAHAQQDALPAPPGTREQQQQQQPEQARGSSSAGAGGDGGGGGTPSGPNAAGKSITQLMAEIAVAPLTRAQRLAQLRAQYDAQCPLLVLAVDNYTALVRAVCDAEEGSHGGGSEGSTSSPPPLLLSGLSSDLLINLHASLDQTASVLLEVLASAWGSDLRPLLEGGAPAWATAVAAARAASAASAQQPAASNKVDAATTAEVASLPLRFLAMAPLLVVCARGACTYLAEDPGAHKRELAAALPTLLRLSAAHAPLVPLAQVEVAASGAAPWPPAAAAATAGPAAFATRPQHQQWPSLADPFYFVLPALAARAQAGGNSAASLGMDLPATAAAAAANDDDDNSGGGATTPQVLARLLGWLRSACRSIALAGSAASAAAVGEGGDADSAPALPSAAGAGGGAAARAAGALLGGGAALLPAAGVDPAVVAREATTAARVLRRAAGADAAEDAPAPSAASALEALAGALARK